MTVSCRRIIGCLCVSGVICMTAGVAVTNADSAQAIAFAGVQIQAAGSVGTGPVIVAIAPPRQTGSTIRTVPISTTSNIGFGDVAAAVAASDASAAVVAASNGGRGNAAVAASPAARPFNDQRMVPMQIGQSSAVAVAGAPNQTYAVILPQRTVYANSGAIVSMTGFQHNAGATPSLNAGGADTFSIGATVEIQQMIEAALVQSAPTDGAGGAIIGGTDGGTSPAAAIDLKRRILLQAFAPRSPFVNIVVSYN